MGQHYDVLTTLVHDLGDAVSAEMYCALGHVVPPNLALLVGERTGLQIWAAASGRVRSQVGEQERDLLRMLLGVYTRDDR
jgi:hypothetical protein